MFLNTLDRLINLVFGQKPADDLHNQIAEGDDKNDEKPPPVFGSFADKTEALNVRCHVRFPRLLP